MGATNRSTEPRAKTGAALALALMAYGILAKRLARRAPLAQGKPASRPGPDAKPSWLKIAQGVRQDIAQKHLSFVAAGAAFHAFVAVPAALALFASLSLLLFDTSAVQRALRPVEPMVPYYVMQLLSDPHSRQTLGLGLLISLLIDVWSVLSGSSCMLTALTMVSGRTSKRSFLERHATILTLAAITVPFMLVSLILIGVLPAVRHRLPLSPYVLTAMSLLRWPILMALFMTVLAASYRYAAHGAEQRWRWMSWGALVAVILWMAGSAVFSAFVATFVPYDRSYGVLGAIIALLTWLNLTAFTVLLGAQINAEIERESDGRAAE